MIYLELFLGFLKVGFFAFGGAYAAIPFIREVVLSYGWLSDEMVTYIIAVSESTPGPIMVNMATYVGAEKGGVLGSAIATLAVILPAFVFILLIMIAFKALLKNNYFKAVLGGLQPCIIGVIAATGAFMTYKNMFLTENSGNFLPDIKTIVFTILLASIFIFLKGYRKKSISPIAFIAVSAVAGIFVYGI